MVAERFAMFVPYIWLDHPMSLATGREVFGYSKSWGWPEFPRDDDNPVWVLDALALNYGGEEKAGRRELLRIERIEQRDEERRKSESLLDAARDLARLFFKTASGDYDLPGLEFTSGLVQDLLERSLPTVFLKQFRSVEDGAGACLQQIVEARYMVERFKSWSVPHRHRLTVHEFDSQPLVRELGLESQDLDVAFEAEMDFLVGGGRVVWSTPTQSR
jgi:hypothetical protein